VAYLLDRDIVSVHLRERAKYPQLQRRILQSPPQDLWISIVGVEEALQGALSLIHGDRLTRRVIERYAFLERIYEDLQKFRIAAYDAAADAVYRSLPSGSPPIGVNDRRAGATAIARRFIVVTRNVRDFSRIPGVQFEDWTLDSAAPDE
jgi:tRNA(fMet)-specific endonuclease VapC